ncbi:MAG: phosphoglycerate kinase [Nitrospinae bacterium]|nr:phosphoglycerate kinase [Nitrospinota bacterium]
MDAISENQLRLPRLEDLRPEHLINKTIFIRVDFNVPLISTPKGYRVGDDTRIRRFLDLTFKRIHELTDGNCRIIIGSHLGRPHKKLDRHGWDGIFNIQFVCSHFDTLIRKLYGDTYTIFPPEITDSNFKNSLEICFKHQLPAGGIKFLPNLRYLLEPRNPDTYRQEFIEELGKISDVFINCAFGCSHRVTKSIKLLPQIMRKAGKLAVAGTLLHEEITQLGQFGKRVLDHPEQTAVIAGGAKIADKISILKQFVESKIKLIFIGGRMVNAFLLGRKLEKIIDSLSLKDIPTKMYENKSEEDCQDLLDEIKMAHEIMTLAQKNNVHIIFPDDYKITKDYFETDYEIKTEPDFSQDFQLDLGPKTIVNYAKNILQKGQIKQVFWNGPLGAYDHPKCDHYAEGSVKLALVLFAAAIVDEDLSVVIGGGDSAAILNKINFDEVKNLVRKQIALQLNRLVNPDLLSMDFKAEDGYTLFNYFTSNFFVSTGGGAALEFLEGYLKDEAQSPIESYLPGTAILLELTSAK